MAGISEFVLNYVVNATWQIAVIAAVATLGSLLLRNGPARYRHLLWLVALASCVVVPLLTATMPLLTATQTISANQSLQDASPSEPPNSLAPVQTEPDSPVTHLTKRRTQVINATPRTGLWLTLCYALFLTWRGIRLFRYWRSKEKLRSCADLAALPREAERVARRCRAIFGIRHTRVVQSSSARVPYTLGARQPLIVLPKAFCVSNEDRLLSVIGHEMAHVARRDYLTNLICELAVVPLSFHPLAFVIKKQIDRARELACDELVAKQLLPPKLYARSLVWAADVSSQSSIQDGSQALLLSMFDARSLEERVMRLTRNKKMLGLRSAKAMTSLMLFALCAAALSLSLFSLELKTEAHALFTPAPPVAAAASDPNIPVSRTETIVPQHPRTQSRPDAPANTSAAAANAEQRAQAACDAGRNGDLEKIPELIALLADDTKTELLRCWGTGRWSPALETFKQPSPGEQAAIALASMGRHAFQPLTNQLDSGNANVRRNAAWAIGELTNMPPSERESAVPRLISLLSDSDSWVRMAAARSLGELRNRSAVPTLIATLADADGRVRELAVWALSELKDSRAVAALCSVLLSDARADVRRGAAEALGEIRSSEALPALKQALNDPNVNARAQWAISEIEGDE